MCGICGFNWEDLGLIKKMAGIINYRGPDQEGYYTDKFVSLGHKRLSIIDLSEKGKQPLCNEEGNIWVTYNGEIYNFKEIKLDLEKRGHKFYSDSDTEVIIHGYEEWGIDCINRFNGMFAFAIWDSKNKKIFLARDRLGVKPLYYFFDKTANKFIFASEIKSIISNPLVKKEINISALSQLVYYAYTINGETLFKNIFELPPGNFAVYDFQDLKLNQYWELKNKINYENENFFTRKLIENLKDSVKKRLVADVSFGASLSGGIDSSSIVAFMSQLTNKPLKTFTIGFNDESDEFAAARYVSEFCKTDHHEKIVYFSDITKNLPLMLWHMESPFAKPAVFATYFLSKEINKNKVTIDLSGEGADELLSGYDRYKFFLENNIPLKEKSKKIVSSLFPAEEQKKNFFDESILHSMKESLKPENIFLSELEKEDKIEHLNTALNFEIRNQLPGIHLTRVDRMSMANSHEIRTPFLDYQFVEFCMTIPSNLKWNGTDKKYILQKAMTSVLPPQIAHRKKIPFHIPLLKYFHEDFIDSAKSILSNSNNYLIKSDKILELMRGIKNKEKIDENSLRQILFFTNLELFNKIFIEKEKLTVPNLNINNFL